MMPPMVTRLIIRTGMPLSTATYRATGMITATIRPPAPAAEITAPNTKNSRGRTRALPRARQAMFWLRALVVPFRLAMPNRNVVAITMKNTLMGQPLETILLTLMSTPLAAAMVANTKDAIMARMPAFFLVMALTAMTATNTMREQTGIMIFCLLFLMQTIALGTALHRKYGKQKRPRCPYGHRGRNIPRYHSDLTHCSCAHSAQRPRAFAPRRLLFPVTVELRAAYCHTVQRTRSPASKAKTYHCLTPSGSSLQICFPLFSGSLRFIIGLNVCHCSTPKILCQEPIG